MYGLIREVLSVLLLMSYCLLALQLSFTRHADFDRKLLSAASLAGGRLASGLSFFILSFVQMKRKTTRKEERTHLIKTWEEDVGINERFYF